jgi:hypothetical protein
LATATVTPADWLAGFQPILAAAITVSPYPTVRIYLVPPVRDLPLADSIVLWNGTIMGDDMYSIMGNGAPPRDETVVIPGVLYTSASAQDESVAMQTAMNRAAGLLDVVAATVRDNQKAIQVGQQTRAAYVSHHEWVPAILDAGGWLQELRFHVTVKARVA